MTIVTSEEIAQFRSALLDTPEANEVLDIIEKCEGNLDTAVEVLSIKFGEGVTRSDFRDSLEELAEKCRDVICKEEFQKEVVDKFSREVLTGLVSAVSAQLTLMGNLPAALAIPIVMFVVKLKIKSFCQSSNSES